MAVRVAVAAVTVRAVPVVRFLVAAGAGVVSVGVAGATAGTLSAPSAGATALSGAVPMGRAGRWIGRLMCRGHRPIIARTTEAHCSSRQKGR